MAKDSKDKKEKKHFFKDFKAELKKVIWPTPKQLVNNTVAVITIVIIVAVIVFVLDFVFGRMNSAINSGIETIVERSTNAIEDTNSIDETGSEELDVTANTQVEVNSVEE